jgi:Domain of unknown function (DUF4166)
VAPSLTTGILLACFAGMEQGTKLNRWEPRFSPLEPVFAGNEGHVPFAFREQFLASPDASFDVVLRGKMHRIWRRPRWLDPLFKALGGARILVPETGSNVPTVLRVLARRNSAGRPYHVWYRTFWFPNHRPVPFPTTIVYDPAIDHVVDLVGPKNMLYMVWKARFTPPGTFTLNTHSIAIRLMGRRIWLPRLVWRWALGVVRFVQRVDENQDDTVHVELIISHPLLGDFFGYNGTFQVAHDHHVND